MARTPISLLLIKRLTIIYHSPKLPQPAPLLSLKLYSTSPAATTTTPTSAPDPPKPSSLSARMSFVFDQIDAIERERIEKDQSLQRIRSWRQSKNEQTVFATEKKNSDTECSQNEKLEPAFSTTEERVSQSGLAESTSPELRGEKKELEVVHPWPEWIELMERLVLQNYFDHRRKDEDKMLQNLGLDDVGNDEAGGVGEAGGSGIDFKDYKTVQTACLNFGKDRFDIIRSLSRQDIQVLVGYGCPSADKKVVFSAKLLRKKVQLDEGDVCSSCSLRSSCERAYLITNKEDEARTIDIMRVLLAYAFDPINGSEVSKTLLKQKSVKNVVRKLLHEVVKLSAVPIDPNLPPPVIKKPPPKVKQPPPPPKRRVGRDDIEMKKGDWLCPKCDFMNFAKNSVCLQCDAKRPKRQLLPGEWECPECNFLNYRRNMACFHCECKRPPDEFMENKMEERQRGNRRRLEKVASRPEVSNAWNFDFDDNESDGADVAAFEYADSGARGEDSSLDGQACGRNFRVHEDDLNGSSRISRFHEGEYSDPGQGSYGRGFDDFDDEDDVDSYELDTQNSSPARKASVNNFSEQGISSSREARGYDDMPTSCRRRSPSFNMPLSKKSGFPGSEDDELDVDSDEDLSVHPKWKSNHVADTRIKNRGRDPKSPSKRLSFGSDEEAELDSDVEDDFGNDFGAKTKQQNRRSYGRTNFLKGSDSEDASFSGSESDSYNQPSRRNRFGRNKMDLGRQGNNFKGCSDRDFVRDTKVRSKGKMGDRRNTWKDDFEGSFPGSRGKNRGFRGNDHGDRRMNDRGSDFRSFMGPKQEGFQKRRGGRSDSMDRDWDPSEFRNSRRVIER